MRFHADGPDIPDNLLEARDKGDVVFLCGSGVSMPAGMPNFLGLAKYVFDKLHVPQNAQLRSLLRLAGDESTPEAARPSLDRIFNQLQNDYPPEEIDYFVAKCLETKPNPCVSFHRTVLRISKSADGSPQVVTTNFDLLFERANKELTSFTLPNLPDLARGQPLEGLVHLHGSIDPEITSRETRQRFILSSSDFGRAYMAEGWATQFVRELLNRFTVVLLGYSANDPPFEYLLQGLQSSEQQTREPIYAFVSESEGANQSVWDDRGVIALTYPTSRPMHAALWDSLEAWANRADDPPAWRQDIVKLARNGPRNLGKHERGQVVSLVRTSEGALSFSNAAPPLPAEWLCVFDNHIRQGEVTHDPTGEKPDHDPRELYGIDNESLSPANLLAISPQDLRADSLLQLAGMPTPEQISLPPRLLRLALWIVSVSHEAITLWWAAKYRSLHPFLVSRIKTQMRQNNQEYHLLALKIWNLLFEMPQRILDDPDFSLFDISDRVQNEGWSRGALREFKENIQPRIEIKSRLRNNPNRPPLQEWANIQLADIATFTIVLPRIRDFNPDIPNDILPTVYQMGRRQLEHAVNLLTDLDQYAQEEMKFSLQNDSDLMMDDEPNVFFRWFCNLLDRMAESYPDLLRADVEFWPTNDPFFFDRLRLRIWSFESVYSGDEAANGILSLSNNSFWNVYYRRDLLHLLRDRWLEFSNENRIHLEQRIVTGNNPMNDEQQNRQRNYSSLISATMLGWLLEQGCELSEQTLSVLPQLRSADPRWQPSLDQNADRQFGESTGGLVDVVTNPSTLLGVPLSEVIDVAETTPTHSNDFLIEYKPFDGLVQQYPHRAVAALTLATEREHFPEEYWRTLLTVWPDTAHPRLTCLLSERLKQLPANTVESLRHDVFSWLKKNASKLNTASHMLALDVLDKLIDKLLTASPNATNSAILGERITGDDQNWSRKTIMYAINGPVGNAVEFLLVLLNSQNLAPESGIPSEITSRLERLISSPGEGSCHAVCLLCKYIERIYSLDPDWTSSTILPWFDPNNPNAEPAWNGFCYADKMPDPNLFSLLKPHFLDVFSLAPSWKWHDDAFKALHNRLVVGYLWRKNHEAYLSVDETRSALQMTNHNGRNHCVHYLAKLIEDNKVKWNPCGKIFLDEAWPKENQFQSAKTTLSLVYLASVTGDDFPDVVHIITPRLVHIHSNNWIIYRVLSRKNKIDTDLVARYPSETLTLINKTVPNNPPEIPFDLNTTLERIAQSNPSLRQNLKWQRLKRITRNE